MNTLCNSRELAIGQVKRLYSTEKQCLMYLKVLTHKVNNPSLKKKMTEYTQFMQKKILLLQQLMATMHVSSETGNTAGINGIVSEGFEWMEKEEQFPIIDAIVLNTLIVSSHYKLGNYRILLHYFQCLAREYEVYVVQTMLHQEEHKLLTLIKLLEKEVAPATDSYPEFVSSTLHSI